MSSLSSGIDLDQYLDNWYLDHPDPVAVGEKDFQEKKAAYEKAKRAAKELEDKIAQAEEAVKKGDEAKAFLASVRSSNQLQVAAREVDSTEKYAAE